MMNCTEVQSQLSEFVDQQLSTEVSSSLLDHLSGCSDCRLELDTLKDCIQQIATLTSLEPPLGFSQRVMAHVRDIEPATPLWQRWIAAFRTKIPLQATAAILVGIIGVYLFRQDDPMKQIFTLREASTANEQVQAKLQTENESAQVKSKPSANKKAGLKTETSNAPVVNPKRDAKEANIPSKLALGQGEAEFAAEQRVANAPRRQAIAESNAVASNNLAKQSRPESKPASPVNLGDIAGREVASAPASVLAQRRPSSGTIIGTPVFNDSFAQPRFRNAPSVLESFRRDNLEPSPVVVGRSLAIPVEPIPDFEIVVRRRADAASDATRKGGARGESGGFSAADRISPAAMPRFVEVFWYSVAANRYEQFKKDIAAQGVIESELPVAIKAREADMQAEHPVTVKVVILPPASTSP